MNIILYPKENNGVTINIRNLSWRLSWTIHVDPMNLKEESTRYDMQREFVTKQKTWMRWRENHEQGAQGVESKESSFSLQAFRRKKKTPLTIATVI